jgi:hypothetical protein
MGLKGLGRGRGDFNKGSLAVEGVYSGCMGWVHAPPLLWLPLQIPYEIPSF